MAEPGKPRNIALDVSHFRPEDLSVNVRGNMLVIEGRHEERTDEDGTVQRHFIRKFALPEAISEDDIKPHLQEDGTLTITFARGDIELPMRNIPIQIDPNWRPNQSRALVIRSPIPMWWF